MFTDIPIDTYTLLSLLDFPVGHILLLQHDLARANTRVVNSFHTLHSHGGLFWTTAHHLPLLPTYHHQGVYIYEGDLNTFILQSL